MHQFDGAGAGVGPGERLRRGERVVVVGAEVGVRRTGGRQCPGEGEEDGGGKSAGSSDQWMDGQGGPSPGRPGGGAWTVGA